MPGWRQVAGWLARSALFVAIAGVGFVVVFIVGAAYPEHELDIYLVGGIVAWGLANWVDSTVFEGGTLSVNYVNRVLDERRERFEAALDSIYREEAEARRLAERYHYLRGVNDAALHPERVRQVIADLKAEEQAAS
jgi:hypothetical protein